VFIGQMRVELASTPDSVPKARHEVTRFADAHEVDTDVLQRMRLAVTEAVANVVVHAYRFGESGVIGLRAACYDDRVDLEVVDSGIGIAPDPDGAGLGFGMGLIGTMADRVEMQTSESGVRITMCFSLN
jgi:stage II sporulation protein AB (anti-sigma F factor)